MPHFVGLDASKATTNICVVNEDGDRVQEGVVETEPRAIIAFLRGESRRYGRVGIEAMSFTPLIYEALAKAGLPIVCIENRHAHNVLKNTRNKTDRNDARGIAEIMRIGAFRAVHIKTKASQEARQLLTARRFLVNKRKDIDNMIGSMLLQLGLKLNRGFIGTFMRRLETLLPRSGVVRDLILSLLDVRTMLLAKIEAIEVQIARLTDEDPICRRLMTAPGVGRITALIYRTSIDIPERFRNSRDVGAHIGLTPVTRQSGATERHGRISRLGDRGLRTALHISAVVILRSRTHPSELKTWGRLIVERRGYWKAVIAVARKLAVILHRMWITGSDFMAEPVG